MNESLTSRYYEAVFNIAGEKFPQPSEKLFKSSVAKNEFPKEASVKRCLKLLIA